MKRYKPTTYVIKVDEVKPRSGHYSFQGSKTTFDNRPKRQRTRAAIRQSWKREQYA